MLQTETISSEELVSYLLRLNFLIRTIAKRS